MEELKGLDSYKGKITNLLTEIRLSDIDITDIKDLYNLDTDFDNFKIDDIENRYNLEMDAIDYKIKLLQEYIQELFDERRFIEYKREKEKMLSKEEYLNYINNKKEYLDKWNKEFIEK